MWVNYRHEHTPPFRIKERRRFRNGILVRLRGISNNSLDEARPPQSRDLHSAAPVDEPTRRAHPALRAAPARAQWERTQPRHWGKKRREQSASNIKSDFFAPRL